MAAPAKFAPRAQFDKVSQRSRRMLAMIHIAKKDLAMDNDDYAQGVFEAIGKTTCEGATEAELDKVLTWMKSKGFKPIHKSTSSIGGKRAAERPAIRKAVALWLSLHHLGVVHNRSDEALEAFAKPLLKVDRLIWARDAQLYQLIEALKSMGTRNGWLMHNPATQARLGTLGLQASLCNAILFKLKEGGAIPGDWGLHDAMEKLCGMENCRENPWSPEDYNGLAEQLGRKLREAGLARPQNIAGEAGHAAR